jgi:hypothetical protein
MAESQTPPHEVIQRETLRLGSHREGQRIDPRAAAARAAEARAAAAAAAAASDAALASAGLSEAAAGSLTGAGPGPAADSTALAGRGGGGGGAQSGESGPAQEGGTLREGGATTQEHDPQEAHGPQGLQAVSDIAVPALLQSRCSTPATAPQHFCQPQPVHPNQPDPATSTIPQQAIQSPLQAQQAPSSNDGSTFERGGAGEEGLVNGSGLVGQASGGGGQGDRHDGSAGVLVGEFC